MGDLHRLILKSIRQMNKHSSVIFLLALILSLPAQACRQGGHTGHAEKKASPSILEPAEGASVQVVSPKEREVFKGDEIPLEFKLVKGKRGSHVHAYVDGELMGMFTSSNGTLTGIPKGAHTLELRVVAADHQTELNAIDTVRFSVQ